MKTNGTLLRAAAMVAAMVLAACGGGKPDGTLDGVWRYNDAGEADDELREYAYAEKLVLSGGAYEFATDFVKEWGPWDGRLERGTFRQTKTDLTFCPEERLDEMELGEGIADAGYVAASWTPIPKPEQKGLERKAAYTLSDGSLRVGDTTFRRAYTGGGAEYTGTMTRGRTNLNIRFTLGGFKDDAAVDTSYLYTRNNTPIPLKGQLTGLGLSLQEEEGGWFTFDGFDPGADTVTGVWTSFDRNYNEVTYAVTLKKVE